MTFYPNNTIILILLSTLCLSACEEQATPDQVAEVFWEAVEDNNTEVVNKAVAKQSVANGIDLDSLMAVNEHTLGRIIIDGSVAEIDTELLLDTDDDMQLPVKTWLLMEDDSWKVNYDKTVAQIDRTGDVGKLMEQLSGIGELFVDELNKSMETIEKALPEIEEGLSEFEQDIQSRLPELRKKLDEFRRKLEESLPRDKKPEEPAEPVEI